MNAMSTWQHDVYSWCLNTAVILLHAMYAVAVLFNMRVTDIVHEHLRKRHVQPGPQRTCVGASTQPSSCSMP
jgi:hypothetical protein